MQETQTTQQEPISKQVNSYWSLSLLTLIILLFSSLILGLFIIGNAVYLAIGKIVLLLIGCRGIWIGVNWLIKDQKSGHSISVILRVLLGILLNFGIIWLAMQFKQPDFTGVITQKYGSNICLSLAEESESTREVWGDYMFVVVESSTPIYIHDSVWAGPKKLVGFEALHPGQRVKVMYDGFILLNGTIYASEIIILGDNFPSTTTNFSCNGLEGI